MIETADVIVIGGGVQGASLAYHLARRGSKVIVVERSAIAAGATGRSSGFVRMHYDLLLEARLAWTSFPYFTNWSEMVGEGDPGFVRTGFLQLVPPRHEAALRANVALQRAAGINTEVGVSLPELGSQRNLTAKTMIITSASQNDGTAWPNRPTKRPKKYTAPAGRAPPTRPNGMATTTDMIRAEKASCRVAGRRSRISGSAGSR